MISRVRVAGAASRVGESGSQRKRMANSNANPAEDCLSPPAGAIMSGFVPGRLESGAASILLAAALEDLFREVVADARVVLQGLKIRGL